GRPTADYLNNILVLITLPGSLFLASIALLPSIFLALYSIPQFPFGGTAILITVGVALETMKQLESQLLMRHYEGFLRQAMRLALLGPPGAGRGTQAH